MLAFHFVYPELQRIAANECHREISDHLTSVFFTDLVKGVFSGPFQIT